MANEQISEITTVPTNATVIKIINALIKWHNSLGFIYTFKGSVQTYDDLLAIQNPQIGDVYNVIQEDEEHQIAAGSNFVWDGAVWDNLGGNYDLSGYAQLNQANTYTALNIFRASIGVSNGTAAGSSGSVSFGVSPTGETVQARIGTDNLGGLLYHASTNQPHVFRVGTNNNVFAIRDDDTKVAFSSNNNSFATVTHTGVAKWLGNANTATTATSAKSATKLATARTITANLASSAAGSFDGSADITVGVTGTLPIANGGTGSTTADAARTALGCAPAYIYSTTDLTAGSSALTTGTLYIVYE